jgi:hypothetical protein
MKIPDLTLNDWEYYAFTPACGKTYYNKKEDKTAIEYSAKINLYYNRKLGTTEKWACCYHNCKTFK